MAPAIAGRAGLALMERSSLWSFDWQKRTGIGATERNHQGLDNQLIRPEAGHLKNTGMVKQRQRPGGMLNYYYRDAA